MKPACSSSAPRRKAAKAEPSNADAPADRLLRALAEEGAEARREDGAILVTCTQDGVGRRKSFALAALAHLLESGAASCVRRGGRSVFIISDAGRARLARLGSGQDEAFGAQHRAMERVTRTSAEGVETLRINRREDPLDLLRRYRGRDGEKLCGDGALAAAARLSRDIAQAQAVPQVTANWSRLVVDGASRHGLTPPERVYAARERLEAALNAVGPDFANILLDICGFSKGLERLEQEHGWPVRSGKVIVSLALKALARHYGLGDEARGRNNAPMQLWTTADARPDKFGAG
jgi:hypothetical protein